MTRKPSAQGPTAEDISRHEEEVAAYLHRAASDGLRDRWKGLLASEKIALMLGVQHAAMSVLLTEARHDGEANVERLTAILQDVAYTTAILDFQIRLEILQGKA